MLLHILAIVIVLSSPSPDKEALHALVCNYPSANAREIWTKRHEIPNRGATLVQMKMLHERRRDSSKSLKAREPPNDEFVCNESILPLSVYRELKKRKYGTEFNVLPVTLWRWNRFVIQLNEEPLFTFDRVAMTTDQSNRMIAGWNIDIDDNRKLFRDTVRYLIARGHTNRGNLFEYTKKLGFSASKKQVTGLLDNTIRAEKQASENRVTLPDPDEILEFD